MMNEKSNRKVKMDRKIINSDKVFECRESTLTEMLNTNYQMKSAYNLLSTFVAVLIIFTIGNYCLNPSDLTDDLKFLGWAFQEYQVVIITWLILHFTIICIFFPSTRLRLYYLQINSLNSKLINSIFTALYVIYLSLIIIFCDKVIFDYKLGPVCSFAILMEKVRLIMKLHSFAIETREPMNLSDKEKDKNLKCYPKLSHFLYFLVAPTLIYRNSYPRTSKIRWSFVFWNFSHYFITIFCTFSSIRRFISSNFSQVGKEPFDTSKTFSILAIGFLMGAQQIFLCFFGFLHCWHNAFAEILRFGDRQFYTSWWNCTKLSEYYRQWNIIVQDWLYTYIYRPVFNSTQNKFISSYSVIITSAIIHEYIIAIPMRFLFPFLFLSFAVMSYIVFLITKSKPCRSYDFDNALMFAILFFGWECQIVLYSIEWYSRINCPKNTETFFDYIIPRFPTCISIK